MHLVELAALFAVLLCGVLGSQLIRLLVWIRRGGSRVVVPWPTDKLPRVPVFSQRRRTRDGSSLSVRDSDFCQLLLWRRPRGLMGASVPGAPVAVSTLLADAATGWTGIWSVAVDCALERNGEPWVITSGEFRLGRMHLSGPHYAPLAACHGAALVRIDISAYIDVPKLLDDLRRSIANPAIRHSGAREALDFLLGRVRKDRVNCSSLAGRAILEQPSSPMAQALRQALRHRFGWGDVTPVDLARAAAILGLCPEGLATPIRTVPILPRAIRNRPMKSPIASGLKNTSGAQL